LSAARLDFGISKGACPTSCFSTLSARCEQISAAPHTIVVEDYQAGSDAVAIANYGLPANSPSSHSE